MHPKQAEIEKRLRAMLDELDSYLEETYGDEFSLHPNRLPRGAAGSPLYDGLFSASSKFTLGYGTEYGRGYDIVIDISTLELVRKEVRSGIEDDAARKLTSLLPKYFPERKLTVVKEGNYYKLIGDFSLGTV